MTLKLYFMKCPERKISQCILPLWVRLRVILRVSLKMADGVGNCKWVRGTSSKCNWLKVKLQSILDTRILGVSNVQKQISFKTSFSLPFRFVFLFAIYFWWIIVFSFLKNKNNDEQSFFFFFFFFKSFSPQKFLEYYFNPLVLVSIKRSHMLKQSMCRFV